MSHRWHYVGDMDLENGGYFWREDDAADYVCVVDVTACADAGGPSNLFHIETGTIFMPTDREEISIVLKCSDHKLADNGDLVSTDGKTVAKGSFRWRSIVAEASRAYHGLQPDAWGAATVVQIGKDEGPFVRGGWSPNPDVILRGNAKLENYVRRECLD